MADGIPGPTVVVPTLRQRLDQRIQALETERSSWMPLWRDVATFLCPERGRFLDERPNDGRRRDQRIVNGTGRYALRDTAAGLKAGLNSPARQWFKLATWDQALTEREGVAAWLEDVEKVLYAIFAKSNFYQAAHHSHVEMAAFGQGPILMFEDFEAILRFEPYTIGEYMLITGPDHRVSGMFRRFQMQTESMVRRFGLAAVSQPVRDAYDRGNYDTWWPVCWALEPSDSRDRDVPGMGERRWRSVYWQPSASDIDKDKYLERSGFKRFPLLCPRWDVVQPNVYGFSPGMAVIGDVKQLQHHEIGRAHNIDYINRPPLWHNAMAVGQRLDIRPGSTTELGGTSQGQPMGPAYQAPPIVQYITEAIQIIEERVRNGLYTDLFRMISLMDRRQVTATEIERRHEEQLLQLGPVVERAAEEFHKPLIDHTFERLIELSTDARGQWLDRAPIPPPPEELAGQDLKVEFISSLHQAQRAVGMGAIERVVSFAASVAGVWPEARHKIDAAQAVDEVTQALGAPARIVRSDDAVAELQAAEQQQQRMAQALAAGQAGAGMARDLAGADMSGDNALSRMAQNAANAA